MGTEQTTTTPDGDTNVTTKPSWWRQLPQRSRIWVTVIAAALLLVAITSVTVAITANAARVEAERVAGYEDCRDLHINVLIESAREAGISIEKLRTDAGMVRALGKAIEAGCGLEPSGD